MCTVLRIKRKITDDPVNCLIVECKRNKLLNDSKPDIVDDQKENKIERENAKIIKELDGDEASYLTDIQIKEVFKYVGSAKTEDDISRKIIELKSKFEQTQSPAALKKTQSLASKYLNDTKVKSVNKASPLHLQNELKPSNNYVLVNKKRIFESDNREEKIENDLKNNQSNSDDQRAETDHQNVTNKRIKQLDNDFNIIDIVSSEYFNETEKKETNTKASRIEQNKISASSKISCNGIEMIREKVDKKKSQEEQFVYDIYLTKNKDLHLDLLYSNNYEIKSSNYYENIELVDEKNLGEGDEEFVNEDDEDSNEEGNWRNDYPEEDDYGDEDIDEENDEDGCLYYPRRKLNRHDDDYDDDYDEYGNDYSEDEDEKKLSYYMKKSLNIGDKSYYDDESDNDDFDEYKNEEDVPNSYKAYKKNLLKEKY